MPRGSRSRAGTGEALCCSRCNSDREGTEGRSWWQRPAGRCLSHNNDNMSTSIALLLK